MRRPIGKVHNIKQAKRLRRKLSIRKKVIGTAERPRVCTIRSNRHFVVQVINDMESKTIASIQTFGKNAVKSKVNREGGKLIGQAVAKQLKARDIGQVVFDRNGNIYTGIIAAVAEGLREEGIKV